MTHRAKAPAPLYLSTFLFALALAGCDTGDPARLGERGPVGTWALERLRADTYLTTSTSQEVIDPDKKGAGRIVLAGDLQGELAYLGRALPTLEPAVPIFASAEPVSELGFLSTPEDAVRLRVVAGDLASVDLFVGAEVRYSAVRSSGVAFDPETHTLSLDDVALSAPGGETVTASGTLAAATQALPAGEASPVGGYTLNTPADALVLTFDEDGTFAATSANEPGEPETTVGTWEVQDGELVLEGDDEAGQPLPPQRIPYRVDEGRLTFEDAEANFIGIDGGALWLRLYEQVYGIEGGALVEVEQRGELEFAATSR